jgi:hypothetical protein
VKSVTQSHIETIGDKIRDFQRIKRRLGQISWFCDGSGKSTDTCPILASLFEETLEA